MAIETWETWLRYGARLSYDLRRVIYMLFHTSDAGINFTRWPWNSGEHDVICGSSYFVRTRAKDQCVFSRFIPNLSPFHWRPPTTTWFGAYPSSWHWNALGGAQRAVNQQSFLWVFDLWYVRSLLTCYIYIYTHCRFDGWTSSSRRLEMSLTHSGASRRRSWEAARLGAAWKLPTKHYSLLLCKL